MSYIFNRRQIFLQSQVNKESSSVQRRMLWLVHGLNHYKGWFLVMQSFLILHESKTKCSVKRLKLGKCKFELWVFNSEASYLVKQIAWDYSFIIWVFCFVFKLLFNLTDVSSEALCIWFRNYWMKLYDMQQVILCDHNSLFDLRYMSQYFFLLYLLSDLKRCCLSWDQ